MAVGLEDIETALSGILLPQPKRSLPQLNMVRDIGVSEGSVKLTIALTVLSAAERERVQERVLRPLPPSMSLGCSRSECRTALGCQLRCSSPSSSGDHSSSITPAPR